MKLDNVGVVIATRELTLDADHKVEVLIGKPERCQDGIDWYCAHQTIGLGSGKVRYAIGVDTVQALVLAMSMIGAELYCSEEYRDGRLSWDCGAVKGDLGIPVPNNLRDMLPGGDQSNREAG